MGYDGGRSSVGQVDHSIEASKRSTSMSYHGTWLNLELAADSSDGQTDILKQASRCRERE